ncbi:hypothetical protein B0H34DRAFT_666620 [Crassisporium funariophilum]|nr:hypothetical protein B0H34DRAFT_666620 [Crassisporium funariophilum]
MSRVCSASITKVRLSNVHWFRRRCISTAHLDPSLRDFTSELVSKKPVFQIKPTCIRVLNRPTEFYDTLLDMIRRAERRIFISSLYIGSGESELISTLVQRLREKPELDLHFLLDINRSTRPGPSSTSKILLPLLREFPSRVEVSMFRSPSLRGILSRLVPPRFNEGWGTWHAKIYGVDDDVMISGANLNKSYFTNRQDRYLLFNSQENLAQYCFDFMKTVTTFSYSLLPASAMSSSESCPNPHSYTHEDYTLHWPDNNTHPHHFNSKAELAFSNLQEHYHQKLTQLPSGPEVSPKNYPLLVPIIQAGQFNIREEESAFRLLFRHLFGQSTKTRPLLDLTSGYFSLYKPYQDLILNTPEVNCRIVAASPKANGFYGSSGISGRIPEGYTLYEKRFMKAVTKARKIWSGPSEKDGKGVLLSEWEKPGWTYHAKGIWLSPNASSPPFLTLFGSTNLNSRSAHIDTELSFLLIIPSEPQGSSSAEEPDAVPQTSVASELLTLRQDLAREIDGIRTNAVEWKGGHRKVRWTTKIIVWLVKGML